MLTKRLIVVLAMSLILAATATTASAAATGQIKGTVTDSATGEAVPGASVLVIGTKLGAMTDFDGEFMVRGIEPGTYTVRITHLDFNTVEVIEVKVKADLTSDVSVKLSKKVTDMGKTVKVVGDAEVIDRFETGNKITTNSKTIKHKPIQTVEALLQQVAGVKKTSTGEEFIRGGRAGEFSYVMDGQNYKRDASKAKCIPRPDIREPEMSEVPYDMFFRDYGTNDFVRTSRDRFSTFAADVDDGAYNIAKQYLMDGNMPPEDAVRVEEFINHFDYGYNPPDYEKFRIFTELTESPFNRNTTIMKIGIKGREITNRERKPLNLTLVIDVSGSMGYDNRMELVKESLRMLVRQLDQNDRVGMVTYGSQAQVVLNPISAYDSRGINNAISSLRPGGSTYAEAGIRMGYDMADRMFVNGHNNILILCSDGVANVGATSPDAIMKKVKWYTQKGITLSTFGFGMGNYNDVLLEQLAKEGNGRYAYINDRDEARKAFVEDFVGNTEVLARDVKIQVEFNPEVVHAYRLLGYENRDVADNKFRDNREDGGEIGAGHEVTAVYELEMNRYPRGDIGTVFVRWKNPDQTEVTEVSRDINWKGRAGQFHRARPEIRLAVVAAQFGEMLKKTRYAAEDSFEELVRLAENIEREMPSDQTRELVDLIRRADNLSHTYSRH